MLSLLRISSRPILATVEAITWPSRSWRRTTGRVATILIIGLSAVLIGTATDLVHPAPPPAAEPSAPVNQVLAYAIQWRGPERDPLLTLPSGLTVKSSNYRGVTIANTTYFYNLAPRPSFDPLARGEVGADQIVVVAVVGDPPNRVMIYTLSGDSPPAR